MSYKHRIFIDWVNGEHPDVSAQKEVLQAVYPEYQGQIGFLHAHIKLAEEQNEANYSFIAYIARCARYETTTKVHKNSETEVTLWSDGFEYKAGVALFNDGIAFARFAQSFGLIVHLSPKAHLPYIKGRVEQEG